MDLEQKKKQLAETQDKQTKLLLTVGVLQKALSALTEQTERKTEDLVNLALREVFPNQRIKVVLQRGIERGSPALKILLRDEDKDTEGEPLETFGGGLVSLLSLVLRVVTIIRQKKFRRFLVLDEPFVQISGEYEETAAAFLRGIGEPVDKGGLGFDCLVITHLNVISEAAHKRYHLVRGQDTYAQLTEL